MRTKRAWFSGPFYLYAGDALSTVHAAAADKARYFTEQWTSAPGGLMVASGGIWVV
jgi:ribulose 1,5-bisphosphate carboxylase large subunit-like protein